jgi:hypothetical protein
MEQSSVDALLFPVTSYCILAFVFVSSMPVASSKQSYIARFKLELSDKIFFWKLISWIPIEYKLHLKKVTQ